MIIKTQGEVVFLSGTLDKNVWMNMQSAARMALADHPTGVIFDCSGVENVTEDGARTFLEAMRHFETVKARILVVNLPPQVLSVCKTVPGVRSQLPIAASIEDARASLRMAAPQPRAAPPNDHGQKTSTILAPLVAGLDLSYGAELAARLARGSKAEVRLVYFLQVARNLPIGSPLVEQQQEAQRALAAAVQYTKPYGAAVTQLVERVREPAEGILAAIRSCDAAMVVIGATREPEGEDGHETFHALVDCLLHRAPCELVVGRLKPPA